MDPFSMSGLIASALSVAEIVTGVGMSCRHLQMEFSGALDHIDNISQQINTINLAIQGINLIFQQRPQSFSPSFQSHFGDSVSAVHNTVRRLQDHVQSVKSEAEISKTRAKLTHLRKVAQVRDWGANLMVQTQSLMLLLQVAQLHSNDERTTRLEKASSRDVFEKASSMSTNLTKSSSHLERKNELIKFPFDSVLLESKVYRRACESSWIRDVTTTMGDGRESNSSGSNSILSVSSNGATASEGYCASSPEDLGTSYGRHGGLEPQRGLRFIHDGGFEGRYMVKISDLGLTGPHNSSIDPSGPETRGGTETYGASEVEHHSRGQHKSYSYDIWTIGCICLEFISWLLEGQVGIDSPKISRSTKILHPAIFQVDDGEAARGLPVSMQVQTLRQSMSGLDLPSSGSLRQLVDVVEWYFEMAGSKRPSAAIVASRMRAAQAMWSEEQDPNVHSGTFSGVVEIA